MCKGEEAQRTQGLEKRGEGGRLTDPDEFVPGICRPSGLDLRPEPDCTQSQKT